jgi:hypothetical protein
MKIKKYLIATAIISVSLFSACTPNSLEDNEEPTAGVPKNRIKKPGGDR